MKKNKFKKLFICLFSFLFIASATVAGGVLLSGSSYSVPVSESSGEEIQENENLTDDNNATSNATEPTNDDSWANHYADSFARGTGSPSDPYQIETAEQLSLLAVNVNSGTNYNGSYFEQTANIDLSAYWWDAIGESSSVYFSGNYDGGDYTISGIYTKASENYQGLFGYVYGSSSSNISEIKNINVKNSNIQGTQYVGGIVGYAFYTEVSYCSNGANVTATSSNAYAGGIAGSITCNSSATIIDISYCFNHGNILSTGSAGGIVGMGYKVSYCYNTGNITSYGYSAGIIAYGNTDINANLCYNTGTIKSYGTCAAGIGGSGRLG